jgi:carboxymethylenebutenolidase
MSHWINLVTAHGRMNGWSAEPDDKPNGGVVLVHDLFGVNEDIRQIAERYAEAGYLTVAPALFDTLQREVELTYEPANRAFGAGLAERLGVDRAVELVNTTADAIGHAGKVAIVGYGWGGGIGLGSATALGLPYVGYDSLLDAAGGEGRSIPALLHHGRSDPRFTPQVLKTYGDRFPRLQVFSYPTGPAFDRQGDPGSHHAESATLAQERTLQFLREHIRHEND